ncbi:alpha-2C adrenergic receptor-like [Cherax quadricarinatus]|uniref:alpha-2C adrenergic receptor-like n=1 Tax=Cherax quadricarinatus TaxID=27406 RepID=UPI00387ED65E
MDGLTVNLTAEVEDSAGFLEYVEAYDQDLEGFESNGSLALINDTFNGTYWVYPWGSSMYPSGYSTLEIVIITVIITVAMIVVVVGNMLVIIAIATEKALKNITNWFIASLAVSDFLLGLVIMPFSLANLLMGYWMFGDLWCELHAAIDVLLSTASINNICLISLDRYWSITHAVAYLKKRTPERAAIMIVAVWLFSGLVSIPPLLGWKEVRAPEEFPKCTQDNRKYRSHIHLHDLGSETMRRCRKSEHHREMTASEAQLSLFDAGQLIKPQLRNAIKNFEYINSSLHP